MSAAPAPLSVGLDIPVAWGEQDLFGHVNNAVFFRWMENVRMHYLERIGVLRLHAEQGVSVILAGTTCNFRRPVHWPCTLRIRTWAVHIGTTSFTLAYELTGPEGGTVADGTSVLVMYDYRKSGKVPVPPAVREAIGPVG